MRNGRTISTRKTRSTLVVPSKSTSAAQGDQQEFDETDPHTRGRGETISNSGAKTGIGVRGGRLHNNIRVVNNPGHVLPKEELLQNSVLYVLLLQHRKIPIKKSDIIKHALNGQTKDFEDVIQELESILNHIFGMKIMGVGETQKSGRFSNYILVSNYDLSICDALMPRDIEVDGRRSLLFLILTVIFMLNRSVDEDFVWKIMEDTKLNSLICSRKENLRRFLKQEYVSTMYLTSEENSDNDPPIVRYSWGFRSDEEFSKHSILKFVSEQFPGKRPIDFTLQYGLAKGIEGGASSDINPTTVDKDTGIIPDRVDNEGNLEVEETDI